MGTGLGSPQPMGVSGTGDMPTGRPGRIPDRGHQALRVLSVLFFLYAFLVAIKALETGIGALGENVVDSIFASVSSPLSALAAGILATVLVQSSSATTAIIVGLVGAGVMSAEAAVPMVMGANIGSAVTSTLAALGHIRQGVYFERGFAAATMQDFYNILAVVIFMPLEMAFGVISKSARFLADRMDWMPSGGGGGSWLADLVKAPVNWLRDWMESLGWGRAVGIILIVVGLIVLFLALWMVTRQMKQLMSGRIENALNTILGKRKGLMAVAVGVVMTLAVQSSGIVNSIMVPLVAAGLLSMNNAFPIILGADLGTTATAVLASVASESREALVIAMAHVVLNTLGIFIFFPERVRRIPIGMATWVAGVAVRNKSWVAVYIIGVFIALPVLILVLS